MNGVISYILNFLSKKKHYWKPLCRNKGINYKRVMVFGDSNAYRPSNNKKCWPAQFQSMGPSYLQVINESCDGRTTRYDSGSLNGLEIINDTLNANRPIDYVIVALGTNDLKKKYGPPSADEIAAGAGHILSRIEEDHSGIQPVLLTPPQLGEVISDQLSGAQSIMPSVAYSYRLVAAKRHIPVVDIHSIIDIALDLEADRIHLNALGRKKIALAVSTYFRTIQNKDK
jgi:lysophospholipase L1-like esterase